MPVRVFWAERGPESEANLRRYWALADEVAVRIVSRQLLDVKMRKEGKTQSGAQLIRVPHNLE
jgi:hypothetical protein